MKTLFIGSDFQHSGKSLVSICMGMTLQRDGKKIGYFKPCGTVPCSEGGAVRDEDALCMIKHLGISDAPEDISPILLTHDFKLKVLRGKITSVKSTILEKFKKVSASKDVMLVEGGRTMEEGRSLDLSTENFIRETGAGLIYIDFYDEDRGFDNILAWRERLGIAFSGLILNRVNPDHADYIEKNVIPYLARMGVPVLGTIFDDSLISAVSVAELVEALGGRVLAAAKHQERLVQHFMIGAMNIESASSHFRKMHNKAVITGGDRTDLQVAALETSIVCLILTGGVQPHPIVLSRADEMKVPIVLVSEDTLETFEKIDHLVRRPRMWQQEKIDRALKLFNTGVKLDSLKL
jgi:uncharacterized protein